jgi:hypothetical protein
MMEDKKINLNIIHAMKIHDLIIFLRTRETIWNIFFIASPLKEQQKKL